jgi:hypothetical protein
MAPKKKRPTKRATKRKSPKKKAVKRKVVKRPTKRATKRKSPKKKAAKRKVAKRKPPKKKAAKRKVAKRAPKKSKPARKRRTSGASIRSSGIASDERRPTTDDLETEFKRYFSEDENIEYPPEPEPETGAAPVHVIKAGAESSSFKEGDSRDQEKRITWSGKANSMRSTNYEGAMHNAVTGLASRSRHNDVADLPIYRFGLLVRSRGGLNQTEIDEIAADVEEFALKTMPTDGIVHIIKEPDAVSVRVAIGNNETPTNLRGALNEMEEKRDQIRGVMEALDDIMEDYDWFIFGDFDEWDIGS